MKKRHGNGSKCGVPGCQNNNSSDCFLSFFRFPPKQKYKLRFYEWCEKIGVDEGCVSPHQCICQNHFEDKYFTSKQRIRLKPHAVPTLQLPNRNPARPVTVPPTNEKRVNSQQSYRTEPPVLSYPNGPPPVPVPVPIPAPVVPLTPIKMIAADPQKPVNHGKPKCFYKYCISRRKSYVSPEPYPYIWTAPKTTDQLEWINFIRKLPPDYVKVQELANKHRFCHLHFEENFIVKGNKYNVDGKTYEVPLSKWRLTPDAYPTLFDPQDQSRDPPRAQSEIKHTVSKSASSLLSVSSQNQNQRQETKFPSSTIAETQASPLQLENGLDIIDNVPSMNNNTVSVQTTVTVSHLSPSHTDNDDSLPSVNSDSVSITTSNANNSQEPSSAKSGRNSEFEGIKNIEENSSSQNSLSFHDMVDMEIQVPVVMEAESEQHQRRQFKDCNKNVSRVLHTPPGDPEPDDIDSVHATNRPEAKLKPGSTCISAGAGSGSLLASGNKTNAEGHAKFKSSDIQEESDRDITSRVDFDGPVITNVRGSDGIEPASGREASKCEEKDLNVDTDDTGHLTDSSVEEIPVVLDSEAGTEEEIGNSNTASAGNPNPNLPNSAFESKRKRKQELSSLNLNCFTSKKSKSKNVEVIDLDSDGDVQIHQTTVTATEKLQPSILKRTIAKITTEVPKQQQQHKQLQIKSDSKLKPKVSPPTSNNNNSFSSSQITKLLPAPVPNLNHQIILVRQSGPGQKKPLKTTGLTQQAQNNSHTGPFVILGSPSLGGGPSIALPLPIPTMAMSAVTGTLGSGGGNPSGSGSGPNKLILLRQPGASTTSNSAVGGNNNNYSNPNSNTKKSLVTLTARELSFLSMPSPDWSVNTYPDIFSISETIMSQDRIEIIRKSITITSSNWLMKFSIFAHDVPAFSSGLLACMGGISEVQHVLNRFAEVPICSGLDLDSAARSTKRKYLESSVSQVRKLLRYDVDHNYRSAECLLVILKNSNHPLETNPETGPTSANSPLRKKPYEFILCGPCQTVEKTFLKEI